MTELIHALVLGAIVFALWKGRKAMSKEDQEWNEDRDRRRRGEHQ